MALIFFGAKGQSISQSAIPEPLTIEVCASKTSSITFPHTILGIDRGSKEVLVQKAIGVDNILLVKAAKEAMVETNVTVVTAAGRLYSFTVRFNAKPSQLNLVVDQVQQTSVHLADDKVDQAEVQESVAKVFSQKQGRAKISDKKYGVLLKLSGLFIKNNAWYFRMQFVNSSNINYNIEQLRFFVRDQKKAKRTSAQEVEIKPIMLSDNPELIRSNSARNVVIVLPKFTIPDQKELVVQVMERNGGRNLQLVIKNRHLFQAKEIN